VFHGGAVQGYRGMMAMLPEQDLGVVILWNSESPLPSGLLPTILDSALGLNGGQWLDDDTVDGSEDLLYAERAGVPAGISSSKAKASPP
jgi:beta-lactamase class C